MGIFKKTEVVNKKGKAETVVEIDFSGVKNWFNNLIGRDTESEELYRAAMLGQKELKAKLDNMQITPAPSSQGRNLNTMNKTTTHTHVFDANGICYQCGFQIRNTSEGNGQGGTQTEKVIKAIEEFESTDADTKATLDKLRELVADVEEEADEVAEETKDEFTKELEEQIEEEEKIEVNFDKVEVTEGMKVVLDGISEDDIKKTAKAINAFYKTLTDVDGKLQVVHYLYEKFEKLNDRDRDEFLSALNDAGLKDESDIIDNYFINNINECLRILTEVW